MKKSKSQEAPKRPGLVDLQAGDEDKLRDLINMCPAYPREPKDEPKEEKSWQFRTGRGINWKENIKKQITDALLPKKLKQKSPP